MNIKHSYWEAYIGPAKYLTILIVLVGIGYEGHHTGWSFWGGSHGSSAASSHEDPKSEAGPKANGGKVEFASDASMLKSGIETALVERRRLCHFVRATGSVSYDQRLTAQLSSRAAGSVWRVVKQAGDQVKKGDTLVVIDAADVGRVKTELLSALINVESKAESLALLEKNKTIGVTPAGQVRAARLALREAKVQLLNAEQTLINYGFSVRKEEFAELDDAARAAKLQFLGLPDEMVRELDPALTSSNFLALKAPFDGAVIGHEATQGELVEVGKPILEIANVSRMWLTLNVPKEDGLNLVLGQKVQFTPDGQSEEFQSRICWINTEVDEHTRTLQVRAEVDNPILAVDRSTGREVRYLRANTFGTGTILTREVRQALSVPADAIISSENGPLVFVRTGPLSFRQIPVTVGIDDGAYVEVLTGDLKPGQNVVTEGSHILKSEWSFTQLASVDS
jgi:cobalt-zinc-cadmium efflux system membrane fusion protein